MDDYNADYWTLGTTFFKGYYVEFDNEDRANAKITIGPMKDEIYRDINKEKPTIYDSMIEWELTWVYDAIAPYTWKRSYLE